MAREPDSRSQDARGRAHPPAERVWALAAAVEQAGEAVLISDPDGIIEYVNPAFERITGYAPDEAVGRHTRMLRSGEHGPEFYRELWKTILGGEVWRGVLTNRRKDGALYEELMTVGPVRDEAGALAGFVAVKRDRSELAALERQLEHSERVRILGQLTGTVAHDFNNLLTAILTSLHLALEEVEPSHVAREDVETARDAAERAAGVTGQLLAFGREGVEAAAPLDVSACLAESLAVFRRLVGERVRVVLDLAEDGPIARAEPRMLHQLTLNLVVNARDAVLPGGGTVTVSTRSVTAGDLPPSVRAPGMARSARTGAVNRQAKASREVAWG